ncbi:MAG: mevalonate kinase [Thermoplasmata archaeon]
MTYCSAPGKVIIFGEHAVLYGEPAIAVAINRRFHCDITESKGEKTTVNGLDFDPVKQPYLLNAINRLGIDEPLNIQTRSELISGAGMGSSAALTISSLGCLYSMKNKVDTETIAKTGFEVEYETQGRASPIDTSTSAYGGGVMLSSTREEGLLWSISKGRNTWNVHESGIPKLQLVLGNTGVHSSTPNLVHKIREFINRSTHARKIIKDIGITVRKGHEALNRGDLEVVGRLMDQNQLLLSYLGVSHPKLDALIDAARKHSYGAKLTGVGGGGVMIAITDEPEETSKAIEEAGGQAHVLTSTKKGLTFQ